MQHVPPRIPRAMLGAVLGAGLLSSPLLAVPALAAQDGSGLVISEAYLRGGSSDSVLAKKFVELHNPTGSAISLEGLSLQYRSPSGTGTANGSAALKGSVPAKGYFLLSINGNGPTGSALPAADQDLGSSVNPGAAGGTLFLAKGTEKLTPPTGDASGADGIIDLLGYGSSTTFEKKAAAGAAVGPTSFSRTAGIDSDNNDADFALRETPTPTNASGETTPGTGGGGETPPVQAGQKSIAEIQGEGASSPLLGQSVTTRGRVTATYASGGLGGYYVQTPGTGGALDLEQQRASDAIFVYSTATVGDVKIGDYVEVTGKVSEYGDAAVGTQTQLTVTAGAMTKPDDTGIAQVQPATVAFPSSETQRESLEGMLVAPQGDYTVTDTYDSNYYGTVGLAAGTTPLYNPTVKGKPGSQAYLDTVERNRATAVTLDDGSQVNFNSAATKATELPYLSTTAPVRVGAATTFTHPVILGFSNKVWTFQPTQHLTRANAADVQPVTFANTRTAAPAAVGGDLRLAGFNVLNYFTTLGTDLAGCTAYTDRAGTPVTVKDGCLARGAWDQASFKRQEAKIVSAINGLDADVVSLEEIENSRSVDGAGADRDEALATLVKALNAAGPKDGAWDYVRSPKTLPANEDVIRTAFIYKKNTVEVRGESVILTGSSAFSNARQPLAQHFAAKGSDTDFVVIANHFKSKGDSSGSASGDNADRQDGVGAYNGDRTRQAKALLDFAAEQEKAAGTDRSFLIGDFNSYAAEDPIQTILGAGYVNQGAKSGKETYAYGGAIGSLDYVFASPAADEIVTGADEWNINSVESIALEYSRHNYNALDLYAAGPYRSSDHDPVVVGLKTAQAPASDTKRLNLLNINDFHGRIDKNTVNVAGTVEELKAQYPGSSAFLSAGDNIGASLFASSVAQDQPTIDVLNALGLSVSATGNHEFDQGADDLTGRVSDEADFDYLAANVTKDGKPILDEYKILDIDGVKVGVIGAITQETPTLVSPGGIQGLTFGDPVDAVNRVADQLSDGDPSNGEADVLVAEYHEGTADGVSNKATLAEALTHGGAFQKIVEGTSPKVDAIFNGHTHAQYAWDAPVPGADGETRPVLQTGSYGEFIGQIVLEYNTTSGETSTVLNHNVPRTSTPADELVKQYPAVAEVKTITDAALAKAEQIGEQKIGSATAEITTAFKDGARDDRASESTLGNFVADSLVATLSSEERGGAEIGVVNPGGLRADLAKGDITYAQANAVLPFVNNLWTTTLSGEQFKTVLEQQWQTAADGSVPSRPYLQLGLSKNVTYTYDETRAQGDRITSVSINGAPLDPQREYRIGSFSFLLQGGDNFRELAHGKDTKDTGLIDRDAWIEYIKAQSPISPSYERRAIKVTGLPVGEVKAGESFELGFDRLDLTSEGVPAVTKLSADPVAAAAAGSSTSDSAAAGIRLAGASRAAAVAAPAAPAAPAAGSLGTAQVKDGTATLTVSVPEDAEGTINVKIVADPTGTNLTVPVTVVAKDDAGTGGSDGSGSDGSGSDGSGDGAGGSGDGAGGSGDGSDGAGDGSDGSGGGSAGAGSGSDGAGTGTDADSDGAGSGGDTGADAGGSTTTAPDQAGQGGGLAATGAEAGGWIAGGMMLTLLGAAGVFLAMRRREESSQH